MDLWGPRRAVSLSAARFRTGLVHILRLVFVIAAMVSAGLLIGPVIEHNLRTQPPPGRAGVTSLTMIGPRFTGRDSNDKPFVLTADTARRRPQQPGLVDLTNPKLEDETTSTVTAREGVYDEARQVLELSGDVVMNDASGYVFNSDKARMFVHENRVESETPLQGRGPLGEVRADTYKVLDNGERVILNGHTWARIIPNNRR